MTILEAIKTVSSYPIPASTIEALAVKRGLDINAECSTVTFSTKSFRLLEADVYAWLNKAPNVSEGGVSFTLNSNERYEFLHLSNKVYREFDEIPAKFGYKGEFL